MAKAKKAPAASAKGKRVAPSSPTSGFMYNVFPNPVAKKSNKKGK